MLADELRRAHERNPEGAQQLRRNLMKTVTTFWDNEQSEYIEIVDGEILNIK